MNFQQLEYAIAVDKAKQFWQAAEDCHITQATLSAMVRKLEDELGLVLFDRSRKPIKTTQEGLAFIEIAKDIIRRRDDLFEIKEGDEQLKGIIKLGIIPTIATSLLPLVLPEIVKENPELKLEVVELTTEEIKKQLYADKIDYGILATPVDEEDLDEHIIYYEPMMVYGITSDKAYVTSKDVRGGQIWLLEEGHCFRNQALTICEIKEKLLSNQNLQFKGSSFETLLNLTDSFGGYTLLPELYFKDLPDQRKLKSKHFETPVPVREISLLSYRQVGNKRAIEYLVDKISDLIKPLLSSSKLKNSEMDIIGIE